MEACEACCSTQWHSYMQLMEGGEELACERQLLHGQDTDRDAHGRLCRISSSGPLRQTIASVVPARIQP